MQDQAWLQNTIAKGLAELETRETDPEAPCEARLRKPGAGRKRATEADPDLGAALERLVDPVMRGRPTVAVALDMQKH